MRKLLRPEASLRDRFIFKLISNVTSVLLGLVTMAVVPRSLGPSDYGRFEFLAANFKLILDSLTLQIPSAFFTWISRKSHKQNADTATAVTLYLVAMAVLTFAIIVGVSIMSGASTFLWPDIAVGYLWEGYGLTLAVFSFQMCAYLADGKALTVGLEKLRLIQNFAKAVIFISLAWFGLMNLHTFFCSQIMIMGLAAWAAACWLYHERAFSLKSFNLRKHATQEVTHYFSFLRAFTRPLVILVAAGLLFNYFDRWFLQLIGGSAEFGYFGLSDRLGGVAFIFTSAMTPLLMREFAVASEERDMARLNKLFDKIRIFLFIAATTSCFLSINSAPLVEIIGGGKFRRAVIPIGIMALYPIHQTLGQLSAGLLVASGRTGLYAKIGIACMIFSVPLAYFLIAPVSYLLPGLELGAAGLAAKMVIVNIIGTNVQLYYNTKLLETSFSRWVLLQVKLIFTMYAAATTACAVSSLMSDTFVQSLNLMTIGPDVFRSLVRLLVSGLLYIVLVAGIVFAAPEMTGSSRQEIMELLRWGSMKRAFSADTEKKGE